MAVLSIGLLAASPAVAGAATAAKAAPMCTSGTPYASTMVLGVNPSQAHAGDTVSIVGSGYPTNCELTVYVDGEAVGNVVTDGKGNFTLPYKVPAGTKVGDLTITTSVGGITKTAILAIIAESTVTPVPPSTTELPRTGSDVLPLVAGGVALLVLGSLVVLSTRKRSAQL